jgi:hypothetical protein
MPSRRARRIGFLASIVIGGTPMRRKIFNAIVRRSRSVTRGVIVVRIVRRVLRGPNTQQISVRTPRAVIDVEGR